MAGDRAAIRYAKAVLSLATSQNDADMVNQNMNLMATTIAENDDLMAMLKSSVIKSDVKKAALLQIFTDLDQISSGLIDLLISNKRIAILDSVALKYTELFDKLNNGEGDIVAHGIGVSEKPEFKQLSVHDDDVIVIASDGVTECKLCRYSMIFGDITMS